jgi:DNA-directed RNA polymerase specialized sigma24 family protein
MLPPQDSARTYAFVTTPWPLLHALRRMRTPTEAQKTLGELLKIYWRPIFVFVLRCGYDAWDAQDLTQRFFVYLIEREAFKKADKGRGKFRSYLLGTLKHFLSRARRDERTQRRGGDAVMLPLDDAVSREAEVVEARRACIPAAHPADRKWALAIQRRVDDRIAAEYADANKSELYLTLRRHLASEKTAGRYKDDARRLGRTVATVRKDVTRMRRRHGELLLEELRKAASAGDLKMELLHYCRVIAAE